MGISEYIATGSVVDTRSGGNACMSAHAQQHRHTHTHTVRHAFTHASMRWWRQPCKGSHTHTPTPFQQRQHTHAHATQILVSKHISSHWRTHMHMHIHAIACISINQQCRYNSIGRQFARQAPSNTVMQPSSPPVIPIGMHAHAYRYGCMHIDIHSF